MAKLFEFTIKVCGWGDNVEEAWDDVKESFDIEKEELPIDNEIIDED